MAKWQYTLIVSDIFPTIGAKPVMNKVWETKGKDGKTDWERVQQNGKDGWELINTFPLTGGNAQSIQVVWVFKREEPSQ